MRLSSQDSETALQESAADRGQVVASDRRVPLRLVAIRSDQRSNHPLSRRTPRPLRASKQRHLLPKRNSYSKHRSLCPERAYTLRHKYLLPWSDARHLTNPFVLNTRLPVHELVVP